MRDRAVQADVVAESEVARPASAHRDQPAAGAGIDGNATAGAIAPDRLDEDPLAACHGLCRFLCVPGAESRERRQPRQKSELFLMKFSRAPRKLSAAGEVYREKKLPHARTSQQFLNDAADPAANAGLIAVNCIRNEVDYWSQWRRSQSEILHHDNGVRL